MTGRNSPDFGGKPMNKYINRGHLQAVMLGLVVVLGVSVVASAQKSLNNKFPKPDFSEMEEHWEIVSYQFDYTYSGSSPMTPQLLVVAKKKEEAVLYRWDVNYYDEDGVKVIPGGPLWFDVPGRNAKLGEPVKSSALAPFMDKMKKVKKIVVTLSDAN